MIFTTANPTIAVPNEGHTLPPDTIIYRSHFKGEMTLNTRYISQSEIAERQFQVRYGAHRARHAFSITGIRQLFGNTLIALGTQLHGTCERRRQTAVEPMAATAIGD